MIIALIVIVVILSLSILGLIITILRILKKTSYISTKEKEFISFSIDMYNEHFAELEISDKEQRDKIVSELNKIKTKYFTPKN